MTINDIMEKDKNCIVPMNIADMTIEKLMSSEDVEIYKKRNVLKLKRTTPTETIQVEIRTYDDATTVSHSRVHRDKNFCQMESTIAQMRAEGKTQAEVASLLGTTQTNISKIEKKMKQRRGKTV